MVVQLLFMGVWLTYVFTSESPLLIVLVSLVMLAAAGYEITKRQQYRFKKWHALMIGFLSISVTSLVLLLGVLTLTIQPQPWYQAQYAIPLLGMLLGNSMTAIGLGLDKQSIEFIKQQSLHAAMIPVINMLVAAGIISLPGMMTGQILAGVEPIEAVKYQIMIMFLVVVSTGFGTLIALHLAGKKLFDERERLRIDYLVKAK